MCALLSSKPHHFGNKSTLSAKKKYSVQIDCVAGVEGKGKGKDERVKREKIGRGRIAYLLPPALVLTFLLPFLRPATQATV